MKKKVCSLLIMSLVTVMLAMTGCGQKAKTSETPAPPASKSSYINNFSCCKLNRGYGGNKNTL